jgi:hypothetical protein
MPSVISGQTPDGEKIEALFYPGGTSLHDLLIIGGENYFGKAQYQMDDPMGDVGFRFLSGERIQAECTQTGKDILGDPECEMYTVFRSSFQGIPAGTTINKPSQ